MADYPMPGPFEFSAEEEKQQRAPSPAPIGNPDERPSLSSQDVPFHGGILREDGPSGAASLRQRVR